MAAHRLAICALGEKWTFLPPRATCEKHKPLPVEQSAARVTWLAKRAGPRQS